MQDVVTTFYMQSEIHLKLISLITENNPNHSLGFIINQLNNNTSVYYQSNLLF